MRRWLVLFLLVLLPLQMSWAAVADYCGHANGVDAAHFGHHGHEDHAHAASVDPLTVQADEGAKVTAADADCGHCHSNCAGALLAGGVIAWNARAPRFAAAADEAARAQPPTPPERPQWRRFA